MMALLISAMRSGNKVELYVDGCQNADTIKLRSVTVLK